jgi:polyisoprenyl-phosphate glycosyltransferase
MNIGQKLMISVVVPVYGCPQGLPELHRRLISVLEPLAENQFEVIFVNDACPNGSWKIVKELAQNDKRIKGINMSRNFGQHHAITAGLDFSKGEWIVVMDCDLQDRPEEIPSLYEKAKSGFDIVLGRRFERHDSFAKRLGSKLFCTLLGYLTDTRIDSTIGNFGIYHCKVIDSLKNMRESLRFFPLMIGWVGFKSATVDITHSDRKNGKSSYSLKKLFKLAFDGMIAFSDKPLKIVVTIGAIISVVSFVFAVYIFLRAMVVHIPVIGWASLMVSLWFIAGLVISILGVIGIYLGKTFNETKHRPLYIIQEIINDD